MQQSNLVVQDVIDIVFMRCGQRTDDSLCRVEYIPKGQQLFAEKPIPAFRGAVGEQAKVRAGTCQGCSCSLPDMGPRLLIMLGGGVDSRG